MKKTAFTLSELMIALTVLGILCAILLPAIIKTMPNQNKVMMKRAYYTTSNVVSDMINDPSLYPILNKAGTRTVGFDNTDQVTYGGKTYGSDSTTGSVEDKYTKFIGLFAAHLNIDGEIEDSCTSSSSISPPSTTTPVSSGYCRIFTTPDGILWNLQTNYTVTSSSAETTIIVDVNGDKKPNCLQGDAGADTDCKARTKNFDRFTMKIEDDGTITIPAEQTWARETIQVSSSLTD